MVARSVLKRSRGIIPWPPTQQPVFQRLDELESQTEQFRVVLQDIKSAVDRHENLQPQLTATAQAYEELHKGMQDLQREIGSVKGKGGGGQSADLENLRSQLKALQQNQPVMLQSARELDLLKAQIEALSNRVQNLQSDGAGTTGLKGGK